MKKLLLIASVLALATASYAEDCGSCCKKKPADAPAPPADKAPEAPKS